jgi:hypothetical protein
VGATVDVNYGAKVAVQVGLNRNFWQLPFGTRQKNASFL